MGKTDAKSLLNYGIPMPCVTGTKSPQATNIFPMQKTPQSKLVITETEDTSEGHLYVFYESLLLSKKKNLVKARRKRIIKNHKEMPLIKS